MINILKLKFNYKFFTVKFKILKIPSKKNAKVELNTEIPANIQKCTINI